VWEGTQHLAIGIQSNGIGSEDRGWYRLLSLSTDLLMRRHLVIAGLILAFGAWLGDWTSWARWSEFTLLLRLRLSGHLTEENCLL
jgi:hypothetical protein